jgi:hypothetical protein
MSLKPECSGTEKNCLEFITPSVAARCVEPLLATSGDRDLFRGNAAAPQRREFTRRQALDDGVSPQSDAPVATGGWIGEILQALAAAECTRRQIWKSWRSGARW